jgi:3-phosphoshikimate 1-carboxyvinyltransferase (EC 2.5.1.19)
MQPLLDALSSIGAQCTSTDGKPPIKIKGHITGGDVSIPGNLSSQFISSLLITAPLTKMELI